MKINSQNPGPIRPEITRSSTPATAADAIVRSVNSVPSSSDRSDRVSISDAGRALAARDGATESAGLDPARAARIRERVLSGAYDTLEVVDAVARRLLDSGDI
jgi:negative regulator of flagellin synthesis FlgM